MFHIIVVSACLMWFSMILNYRYCRYFHVSVTRYSNYAIIAIVGNLDFTV